MGDPDPKKVAPRCKQAESEGMPPKGHERVSAEPSGVPASAWHPGALASLTCQAPSLLASTDCFLPSLVWSLSFSGSLFGPLLEIQQEGGAWELSLDG